MQSGDCDSNGLAVGTLVQSHDQGYIKARERQSGSRGDALGIAVFETIADSFAELSLKFDGLIRNEVCIANLVFNYLERDELLAVKAMPSS